MEINEEHSVTIPFGKYKDRLLKDICSTDPRYLSWLISPYPRGRWAEKYPEFAKLMADVWQKYDRPFEKTDEGNRRLIAVTVAALAGKEIQEQEEEEPFSFACNGSDADWYFSAKSLVFEWARLIGPEAFLVHHYIKCQCPERGLKGRPIDWPNAHSILGMSTEQVEDGLRTLKRVGLLRDEDDCIAVLDPDEVFSSYRRSAGSADNADK